MEADARPPQNLFDLGNLSVNWNRWKKEFHTYVKITKKSEDEKVDCLKNFIGPIGLEALKNIYFIHPKHKENITIVLEKLDHFFSPVKNEQEERFNFFSKSKERNKSIEAVIHDLRKMAKSCNFGDQTEKLIRDAVILGIRDNRLRNILFEEKELTLDRLIIVYKTYVFNLKKIKDVSKELTTQKTEIEAKNVDPLVSRKEESCRRSRSKERKPCWKCGVRHAFKACPALNFVCNYCNELNHFSIHCPNKDKSIDASNTQNTVQSVEKLQNVQLKEHIFSYNSDVKKSSGVSPKNLKTESPIKVPVTKTLGHSSSSIDSNFEKQHPTDDNSLSTQSAPGPPVVFISKNDQNMRRLNNNNKQKNPQNSPRNPQNNQRNPQNNQQNPQNNQPISSQEKPKEKVAPKVLPKPHSVFMSKNGQNSQEANIHYNQPNLQNNYSNLQNNYSNLQNNYSNLKNNHSNLQEKLQQNAAPQLPPKPPSTSKNCQNEQKSDFNRQVEPNTLMKDSAITSSAIDSKSKNQHYLVANKPCFKKSSPITSQKDLNAASKNKSAIKSASSSTVFYLKPEKQHEIQSRSPQKIEKKISNCKVKESSDFFKEELKTREHSIKPSAPLMDPSSEMQNTFPPSYRSLYPQLPPVTENTRGPTIQYNYYNYNQPNYPQQKPKSKVDTECIIQ